MRPVYLSLLAVLALSNCSTRVSTPPLKTGSAYSLSAVEKGTVQSAVLAGLKDPDSARFGAMSASKDLDGVVVICGLVNARNSFGGYVGMSPYYGVFSQGRFIVGDIGSNQDKATSILKVCQQMRVDL